MASLSEDPGKRGKTYRVLFLNADRERKTVRIGAMARKNAETIRSHIDRLEACLFDGSAPPPATAAARTTRRRAEQAPRPLHSRPSPPRPPCRLRSSRSWPAGW